MEELGIQKNQKEVSVAGICRRVSTQHEVHFEGAPGASLCRIYQVTLWDLDNYSKWNYSKRNYSKLLMSFLQRGWQDLIYILKISLLLMYTKEIIGSHGRN